MLKTRDVPRDRVTHLLQAFPTPANGIHLPADLPLLLVGQNGVERPRIWTAVPGTGDLCAKKTKKTQTKFIKEMTRTPSIIPEQSRVLTSAAVPSSHHWMKSCGEGGREGQTLELKDILAALEGHD